MSNVVPIDLPTTPTAVELLKGLIDSYEKAIAHSHSKLNADEWRRALKIWREVLRREEKAAETLP